MKAPKGVPEKNWQRAKLALRAAGMPSDRIERLATIRQMNLYIWLVTVMQHPWQFVADNEEELLKPKIDKSIVKYKGKKAT